MNEEAEEIQKCYMYVYIYLFIYLFHPHNTRNTSLQISMMILDL